MDNSKLISINVRGLGSRHKREDVINYLVNMKCDIMLLQDTHLIKSKVPIFDSLWTGKAYHSCFRSNSRGTSILISSHTQHEVIKEYISNEGNYIILHCKIGTDTYALGSIYGPNRDEPHFYEHIDEILASFDCDHIVLGGDFNFIMDADSDSFGYLHENNVNARKTFMSLCDKHNIIDIWRYQNPTQKHYTWFSASHDKGSRLDMFFVSGHLSNRCNNLQINPGYRTDHSILMMILQHGESRRGPGLWKFNESLLNEDEYIDVVNKCIHRTIEEYAVPIYTHEFLSLIDNYDIVQFRISDDLFYETLLMMIRGESVKYSKIRAKKSRAKENELIKQISLAHTQYSRTKNKEDARRLALYQEELEDIRKPLIDGLIVRSKTRWHEQGEKSSKYFLSLEKSNAIRKTPSLLKIGDRTFTNTFDILRKFSENLSAKNSNAHSLPHWAEESIMKNSKKSLTKDECEAFEQPISFKELTDALQKMKKGKSPGSNGFTACFFRYFWKKIGPFLYRAFMSGIPNNKTLISHREGVITMIPKAGSSLDGVKGWRPITLLNVDFKIISAAVAARLQSVANNLIDNSQTAYIKGRFIGENTRVVHDIINHLVENEGTGLILSADFEAAFDSLSWEFIKIALVRYGFGPYFRGLIGSLYLNTENFSRIILNGHLGDKIHLKCGIRQGDPSSGYIFNFAVNILSEQIKKSNMLTGIKISEENEIRISQYADDTVLFLENSSKSLQGSVARAKQIL